MSARWKIHIRICEKVFYGMSCPGIVRSQSTVAWDSAPIMRCGCLVRTVAGQQPVGRVHDVLVLAIETEDSRSGNYPVRDWARNSTLICESLTGVILQARRVTLRVSLLSLVQSEAES